MTSSGVGRLAAWASRIRTISAAASGREDASTSAMPLSRICQARVSSGMAMRCAKSRPLSRSTSDSDASSAAFRDDAHAGHVDGRSPRDRTAPPRARLLRHIARRVRRARRRCRRDMTWPNRSTMRPRSATPSMDRTAAASTRAGAVRDGLIEKRQRIADRTLGGARDAASASASASTASLVTIASRWRTSSSASTLRRSKRWQRDRTVIGTLRISVVAKMNFTCSGGSSSVFRRPLKAASRACAPRR